MSNGRIAGKIALITGGARGQGRQEAERFAAEGATVYITDVLDDVGAAAADELGDAVTFLHHDVTSEDDWAAVIAGIVEQHGRIDILVNNAGIFSMTAALDTSIEAWNQMVAINQTGVFLGIRDVGRVMCEQGSGSIINISSINSMVATKGIGGRSYETSKAAINQFTKACAVDWAEHGITVNAICPGGFMTEPNIKWSKENPELIKRFRSQIPMGDHGQPEDLGPLAVYLASDAARYVTGATMVIDGGYTLI